MILKNLKDKNISINLNGKFVTLPASGELKTDYDIYLNQSIKELIDNGTVEYYDTEGRKLKLDNWDETTVESKSTKKYVPATSVALKVAENKVKMGETLKIEAIVEPDNATDKEVTWVSYNTEIATVADGTVTPVKEGKVIISATVNSVTTELPIFVTASE